MKILQVAHYFSPLHGGGEAEVPYQLSKELVKRGHEVTIYCTDFKSYLKLEYDYVNSVPGADVRSFKIRLNFAGINITPGMINEMKKKITQTDIVHVHNYRSFQNILTHHYTTKHDVPYILQAHGSLPREPSVKKYSAFDRLLGYKTLGDAARVIAVTEIEAEQFRSMGVNQNKIEVIPHGINPADFQDLPDGGEFKRKLGLTDNQRIILFLGRIHLIKGLDLLLEAFGDLSQSLPDIRLVIAGPDGGYLASLKELIARLAITGKVSLPGPLYGREKLAAYTAATVFVLPSIYEIFGITVLEALACGTPVIVTDHCGIADIVNKEAGLAVPRKKERLKDALLQILGDDELRHKFGERGKALAREKFSWEKIAEKIERVYREILE